MESPFLCFCTWPDMITFDTDIEFKGEVCNFVKYFLLFTLSYTMALLKQAVCLSSPTNQKISKTIVEGTLIFMMKAAFPHPPIHY